MKILRWILFAAALALLCVEVDAGQRLTPLSERTYPVFNSADSTSGPACFDG